VDTGNRGRLVLIAAAVIAIIAFTGAWLGLFGDGFPFGREDLSEDEPPGDEPDPVEALVVDMTLDEKIGQLFMLGFRGTSVGDELRELVQESRVGGIIIFPNNIVSAAQLVELTNGIKALNEEGAVPLFFSVDQEGGRVSRLPPEATTFPRALAVGTAGSTAMASDIGKAMGEELLALGINLDLAPVLDVNNNPNNPVIGDRSFGDDPEVVREIGIATMKGLQSAGVVTAVKHFPGHGDTSVDSHVGLPMVPHGRQRLDSVEFVPFKAAIEAGADIVMSAHIVFPALDDSGRPATLSKPILTGILREEFGFDGVVMTDSLSMGAITQNFTLEEAVLGALDAGADVLLFPAGRQAQVEAIDILKAAVTDGRVPEARIEESVKRIVRLKLRYELDDAPVDLDEALEVLNRSWHRQVVEAISR